VQQFGVGNRAHEPPRVVRPDRRHTPVLSDEASVPAANVGSLQFPARFDGEREPRAADALGADPPVAAVYLVDGEACGEFRPLYPSGTWNEQSDGEQFAGERRVETPERCLASGQSGGQSRAGVPQELSPVGGRISQWRLAFRGHSGGICWVSI